jgi:hypothetical protein
LHGEVSDRGKTLKRMVSSTARMMRGGSLMKSTREHSTKRIVGSSGRSGHLKDTAMLQPRLVKAMAVVAFRCKKQPEKPLAWRRTQSEREKLAMGGWVWRGRWRMAPP